MFIVKDSLRSMQMSSIMKSNPIAAAQASAPAGSVFRNLMSAPPPPPPPPSAPPAEYKPVRPSIEPNAVDNKVGAGGEGSRSGIEVQQSSAQVKKAVRQPMFTANELRRNYVMTEILGKPVSMRRK